MDATEKSIDDQAQATAPQVPVTSVQMPQVPAPELARHILEMLAKVNVTADESSIIIVIQARGLLGGIASGHLVVGRPATMPAG